MHTAGAWALLGCDAGADTVSLCVCERVSLCVVGLCVRVRVCVYVCVCARTDSAAQCRDRNELSVHRLRRQADHQGRSDGVKAQIAAQSEWRAA